MTINIYECKQKDSKEGMDGEKRWIPTALKKGTAFLAPSIPQHLSEGFM